MSKDLKNTPLEYLITTALSIFIVLKLYSVNGWKENLI